MRSSTASHFDTDKATVDGLLLKRRYYRQQEGKLNMTIKSFDMAIKTIADLQALHTELGIPVDYAQTSGLAYHEEPAELVDAGVDFFGRPAQLAPAAHAAWLALQSAAAADGVILQLVSAFRSVVYQADMIARKLAGGRTLADVLAYNAAPGYSEHHTGRAIDIGTPGCAALEVEFDQTQAFEWLCRHADEFGFLLSYPKDTVGIIQYEPWHWCFHPDKIAAHPLHN
jgi:D-alanyl-D-alanine carboxypeptidase